jgi:DNA-directed RNA polymerase subunit M/transcription elongation factor TFIIS
MNRDVESGIYFVGKRDEELAKTSRACPECGHGEAFFWVSNVGGEHAGVRRERVIEHFRCAACANTWSESS